jgi:AcrR family transcriptional regulator
MQRPCEQKRGAILKAAAHFFASRPFHEVRLDDIAERAGVGKGTLYVYFDSKEALYLALVRDGFATIVDRIRRELAAGPPGAADRLGIVVEGLIGFGTAFPDVYRVMRTRVMSAEDPSIQEDRRVLSAIIEDVLRTGIDRGEISDPHPEITTQFILAFIRGALLYPPEGMTLEILKQHLLHVLLSGIGQGRPA